MSYRLLQNFSFYVFPTTMRHFACRNYPGIPAHRVFAEASSANFPGDWGMGGPLAWRVGWAWAWAWVVWWVLIAEGGVRGQGQAGMFARIISRRSESVFSAFLFFFFF